MPELTIPAYLEAARRDGIAPNPAGTLATYVKSSYSFATHAATTQLCVLDLTSGHERVLLADETVSAPVWLDSARLAWLGSRPSGSTQLVVADVANVDARYTAGTIPGPVHGLRVRALGRGRFAVAFAGKRERDGTVYNPADASKPLSSAQYYTSTMVREWDAWFKVQRNAIFYGLLEDDGGSKLLSLSKISCALANDTERLESPLTPLGSKDCFDIAPDGIVFVARDPLLNSAMHTKCNTFFVEVRDFASSPGMPREIKLEGLNGAASSPVVSPAGDKIALLKMEGDLAESDQNHIIVVQEYSAVQPVISDLLHEAGKDSDWPLSTHEIAFLSDNSLLLITDDAGRASVFTCDVGSANSQLPQKKFHDFDVEAAHALPQDRILVSGTSFVDSSIVAVAELKTAQAPAKVLHSESSGGSAHGFFDGQVTEFMWQGVEQECQAFVMKPFNYKQGQKYPLCIWVHGGPQYMEGDRWNNYNMNPHPFCTQGYVVVMPNPTGSRGFGRGLMEAIKHEHGGKPYQDLVKLFEHVEQHLEFADTSRAILGGLSYGGYMTNWIQGHDLGRKFKALFTLNGIYSSHSMLATEELFFMKEDYGGLPWESDEARKRFDRWDPALHTAKWATPHVIVHTGQDYRCTLDNGLAAFNTLQAKGIDSAFLYFEDECHLVAKPENLLVMWNTVLAFCNRHVGLPGTTEPPPVCR